MDELKKYGDNIVINDYEKNVLIKCNIDVSKCKTIQEVLLLIDRYLDDADLEDEEYDEIDYVANNLQFDNTKNSNWKVISKEEIANQKLVNARLQDKVNTFNTIITTTENSTISKTPLVPVIYSQTNGGNSSAEETLYLTQSITPENESSDLTYKNIVEIVKTSNTVGRINSYSIVGNQDPTSEPAEVDSDKAEVVKILPPFGEMKNIIIITSTILAAVGILVIGIIVIKKKFLKK